MHAVGLRLEILLIDPKIMETENNAATGGIPQEVIDLKVREAIASSLELDLDEVTLSSTFVDDLNAESLDMLDIAFSLEQEVKIEFPRVDLLERAADVFGHDTLIKGGIVTDLGLEMLAKGMPEIDESQLRPGMRAMDVTRLVTVASFVRVVTRLIEAKAAFSRTCPTCGGTLVESETSADFTCEACGAFTPCPSGDEVLLQDLIGLMGERRVH